MKRVLILGSFLVGVFLWTPQTGWAGNSYSISLVQTTVHSQSSFDYEWTLPADHPDGLWIGLFRVGDSKWNQLRMRSVTIYDYARKLEFGGSSETVPGPGMLVVPGTALELRMYNSDRSVLYATSPTLLVVDDATPVVTKLSYVKDYNATYAITTSHTRVKGNQLIQYGVFVPQGHPFLWVGLYFMGEPSAWKPVTSLNYIDWPRFNNGNGQGLIQVPNPLTGVPTGSVLELRIYSQDRSTLLARSCPMLVVPDSAPAPSPLLCTAVPMKRTVRLRRLTIS